MRLNRLIAAVGRPQGRGFTGSSGLRWTVARMISTNSLAAFTQEVARNRPVTEAAPSAPVRRSPEARPLEAEPVAQRRLETVPPLPSKPLPRGSLLDLRA
jgi:hypothetical protein